MKSISFYNSNEGGKNWRVCLGLVEYLYCTLLNSCYYQLKVVFYVLASFVLYFISYWPEIYTLIHASIIQLYSQFHIAFNIPVFWTILKKLIIFTSLCLRLSVQLVT